MIRLHGRRLASTKSETGFLKTVNLYGVTQRTLLKLGVKHHTRSQLYHPIFNLFITYTFMDQKSTPENTTFNYYVSNIHI